MHITLESIQPLSANVNTFWFRPPHGFKYTAGQFIELYIPHDNPDERGIKHWFTLSSSPTEPLISITTRHGGDKVSTFKQHLFASKLGTEFYAVEPMGDFVLPKDHTIPLVFVAGGIGVTPFRSMIKYLTDEGEKRQIQVLLAANEPNDLLFLDIFITYGIEPLTIVSHPTEGWTGAKGLLDAKKIQDLAGDLTHKRVYVSGPEPMVEAIEKDLLKNGLSKDQLVFDYFPNYRADLK